MVKTSDPEGGFSLIEVLLGACVFSIGMLGIATMLVSSVKGTAFSGNLTEATTLATTQLEELLVLPYSHAALTDKQTTGQTGHGLGGLALRDNNADGTKTGEGRNGSYTIYWNVAEDVPLTGCKTIRIWVGWTVKNNERSIAVTGIRTGVL